MNRHVGSIEEHICKSIEGKQILTSFMMRVLLGCFIIMTGKGKKLSFSRVYARIYEKEDKRC